MSTPQHSNLNPSAVSVRLSMCLAAAGGSAALTQQADAAIVTFNNTIVVPQTVAGIYINLLTGATGSSGGTVAGWDFNPYNAIGQSILGFYWNQSPSATSGGVAIGSAYQDLAVGTVIGPASTFTQSISGTNGTPFQTSGDRILGFRFQNENTNTINYGYLRMTTTGGGTDPGFPATITGWAFEDSGASITVAPIPEPSTTLLAGAMALGALGMRGWRRGQRAAA